MLEPLLCFSKFLYILELIKVGKDSHDLRESMKLQNIKKLKGFLPKKKVTINSIKHMTFKENIKGKVGEMNEPDQQQTLNLIKVHKNCEARIPESSNNFLTSNISSSKGGVPFLKFNNFIVLEVKPFLNHILMHKLYIEFDHKTSNHGRIKLCKSSNQIVIGHLIPAFKELSRYPSG